MTTLANHSADFYAGLEDDTIPYGLPADQCGATGGINDADLTPQDQGSDEPQEQEDDDVPSPSDQSARDAHVAAVMAPLAACADVTLWKVGHMEWRQASVEGGEATAAANEYRVVVDIRLRSGLWLCGIGRDLADAVLKIQQQVVALRAATEPLEVLA